MIQDKYAMILCSNTVTKRISRRFLDCWLSTLTLSLSSYTQGTLWSTDKTQAVLTPQWWKRGKPEYFLTGDQNSVLPVVKAELDVALFFKELT